MLKRLFLNRIDAFECKTGYDSSWLRDIVRGSTRAALGVSIPGAAGIVALDFGLDLLIELTTAVTLGMSHAR